VQQLAKDALRHRLVLSYQALAESISPDQILDQVLEKVPAPAVSAVGAAAGERAHVPPTSVRPIA
jgi:MoxR-like ATPase